LGNDSAYYPAIR